MSHYKTAEDVEREATAARQARLDLRDALVLDLRTLADGFADAAARADNDDDVLIRRRAAQQIRFVAIAAQQPNVIGWTEHGADWLKAGRATLAGYDAADMDAVHASRSTRRGYFNGPRADSISLDEVTFGITVRP